MTSPDAAKIPRREARVSLTNLRHNIDVLGSDNIVLDISANAYGHGLREVVRAGESAGVKNFRVRSNAEYSATHALLSTASTLEVGTYDEQSVIHCYGLNPGAHRGTRSVMRLSARIMAVKAVRTGEGVSYGYTWRAPSDGWLALVPLGYADGFVRAWSNLIAGTWRGSACVSAGRVTMDSHSLFTEESAADIGDEVVYFGDSAPGAASVADVAGLVSSPLAAITACLGSRIERTYVS
jgi:alanine racemase